MKKIMKYLLGIMLGVFVMGCTVFAEEYTVTEMSATFTTNELAALFTTPDMGAMVIPPELVDDGVVVLVTGVTSNGFYRADVGAGVPFYFNSSGLNIPEPSVTTNVTTPTPTPAPVPSQPKIYNREFIFTGHDPYGNVVTQDIAQNANIIILNLWEAWCEPSKKELAAIQKLYDTYKNDGLLVIGGYSTSYTSDVINAIQTYGMTYPIVEAYFDAYQTLYLPTTWILDGNGNKLHTEAYIGSKNYEALEKLYLEAVNRK